MPGTIHAGLNNTCVCVCVYVGVGVCLYVGVGVCDGVRIKYINNNNNNNNNSILTISKIALQMSSNGVRIHVIPKKYNR